MTKRQEQAWDLIVVGGGAAGMMAAGTAARRGKSVLLIEKKKEPGRKIMITGKGRCNLTNHCSAQQVLDHVVSNPRFLYSALFAFSPQDTISFFEELGVALKTERGGRVFPASDRSEDIVSALRRFLQLTGVSLLHDTVAAVKQQENGFWVRTASGEGAAARQVLIATGGLSYPRTGSTGDGYVFAKAFGHRIVPTRPALVGLCCTGDRHRRMQGLSLRNTGLQLLRKCDGKCLYRDQGEVLFTHFGLSGPTPLSASSYLTQRPQDFEIVLDLKPGLSNEMLSLRLERDFRENLNRDFINSLGALLPRLMIPVIVEMSGIPPHKKVHQITRQERTELCSLLKAMPFSLCGTEPVERAIVTAGGVCVEEVDPKTMQSKLVKGVYFAGEVLDVDAVTGGYNLQIAFSTGVAVGNHV